MYLVGISGNEESRKLYNAGSNSKTHHYNYQNFGIKQDTFDDGKISKKDELKHLVKGFISPVTSMFSSPKTLLIGAGTILASAALCAAFPPLLPAMVVAGVVTGTYQTAKGIKNAASAKTDKQAEQAFEGIGSGVFALGTSVFGAKSSLKAAGVKGTEDLNFITATIKCFKELPASFTKSFKMAKNGTAFENLKNTITEKVITADQRDLAKLKAAGFNEEKLAEVKEFSKILHQEGVDSIASNESLGKKGSVQELLEILPEELRDKVKYRVKSESSIKDKLIKKMTSKDPTEINSIEDARNEIGDLIGTNIALDKIDATQMDELVEHLANATRNGKIKILAIDNYRGEGIDPYFSSDHIDALREAAKANHSDLHSFEGFGSWKVCNDVKDSGYTTSQINIQYQDGSLGEFQIRGKGVQKLAGIEHIPYDLRQKKDLSGGNPILKKLYKPLEKDVKLLSNEGYDKYNNYLNALYKYYRQTESGAETLSKPKITDFIEAKPSEFIESADQSPKTFNKIVKMLDIDNIEKLHDDAEWLKAIPKTTVIKALQKGSSLYLSTKQQEQTVN